MGIITFIINLLFILDLLINKLNSLKYDSKINKFIQRRNEKLTKSNIAHSIDIYSDFISIETNIRNNNTLEKENLHYDLLQTITIKNQTLNC